MRACNKDLPVLKIPGTLQYHYCWQAVGELVTKTVSENWDSKTLSVEPILAYLETMA